MAKFFAGYTARSAYNGGIGSRIVDVDGFTSALAAAVESFDFTTANPSVRTEGQGFLMLPGGLPFVSSGIGAKRDDPSAYVLRSHRGEVSAFLRREHATPAESLAVVVYTRAAYLAALELPDTAPEVAESERVALAESDATHCVVAVLANAGPASLGPGRLVSNLAGGNADALTWSADEIREKAKAAQDYANGWSVVAD